MNDITNKQDTKENQELLERAEDEIEHRRQWAESFGLAPGESCGSIGRTISFCKLLSAEERNRLKGTAVEECDKDLFAIADMGNTKERAAMISAISNPDNPAPPCKKRKNAQVSAATSSKELNENTLDL